MALCVGKKYTVPDGGEVSDVKFNSLIYPLSIKLLESFIVAYN